LTDYSKFANRQNVENFAIGYPQSMKHPTTISRKGSTASALSSETRFGRNPGRAVRLLTTTGIGAIPGVGLVAGFAASIVDAFLLEKVLPRSGVVAFLSDLYPSVFEDQVG